LPQYTVITDILKANDINYIRRFQAQKLINCPSLASVEGYDLNKFGAILEKEIAGYEGEFSQLIAQAPDLYKMMTRILDDHALPSSMSPLVIAAIAYFILPDEIISEEEYGPIGYSDDIYLCAFVANEITWKSGSHDILVRNWDGFVPIVTLIKEILDSEKDLIGDKKNRIMQYLGWDKMETTLSDCID
jgi:uncharacterized membrane protein YkvA (DUF1232 family)